MPGWLVLLIFLGIFGFIFFQSGGRRTAWTPRAAVALTMAAAAGPVEVAAGVAVASVVAVLAVVAAAALAAAARREDGEADMLTKSDQDRIAAAIAEAESKTSGEIFCVLAREVSRYREVPLLWGAFAGFVVLPLLVLAGLHRLALASIFSSWTEESVRAMEGLILRALTAYGLLQAGVFPLRRHHRGAAGSPPRR